MRFYFLELDVDVLAPTVNDQMSLATGIAEPVEHLQRAIGTSNRGNIKRQHVDDIVGRIKCRYSRRVKRMRQIDHHTVESLSQEMQYFGNVLRFYVLRFMRFGRRG